MKINFVTENTLLQGSLLLIRSKSMTLWDTNEYFSPYLFNLDYFIMQLLKTSNTYPFIALIMRNKTFAYNTCVSLSHI